MTLSKEALEMDERRWNDFDNLAVPASELGLAMSMLPGEIPQLTEDYMKAQRLYQVLFGLLLLSKTALGRLDQRIADRGYSAAGDEDRDFFQKYDLLGLQYFYLRTLPRIERLKPEDYQKLTGCLAQRDEASLKAAMEVVEATYHQVMAAQPDAPEQWFELFPSVHGEGRVQGKSIVLAMKSLPSYDSHGMLLDENAEQERTRAMHRVKEQLEPILQQEIGSMKVLLTL